MILIPCVHLRHPVLPLQGLNIKQPVHPRRWSHLDLDNASPARYIGRGCGVKVGTPGLDCPPGPPEAQTGAIDLQKSTAPTPAVTLSHLLKRLNHYAGSRIVPMGPQCRVFRKGRGLIGCILSPVKLGTSFCRGSPIPHRTIYWRSVSTEFSTLWFTATGGCISARKWRPEEIFS